MENKHEKISFSHSNYAHIVEELWILCNHINYNCALNPEFYPMVAVMEDSSMFVYFIGGNDIVNRLRLNSLIIACLNRNTPCLSRAWKKRTFFPKTPLRVPFPDGKKN